MIFQFNHDFEFNLLNIENFNTSPRLMHMKRFIKNNSKIKGDYCEFGVFQGSSLISIAILFKKLKIKKLVYGFDSFSGFPNYHKYDETNNFKKLFLEKKISKYHYSNFNIFKKIKIFNSKLLKKKKSLKPKYISSSQDFSNNSYAVLLKKIKYLELNNIRLIKGDFKKTIPKFFNSHRNNKIFAANIDCDLYSSYKLVLPILWKRLSYRGLVLLDEYYSLKFPGARIACNEFFKKNKIKPYKIKTWKSDFERWYFKKK